MLFNQVILNPPKGDQCGTKACLPSLIDAHAPFQKSEHSRVSSLGIETGIPCQPKTCNTRSVLQQALVSFTREFH